MKKTNSMYFNQEQVTNGEMFKFISILCKQCYGKGSLYNDIHIYPEDCGAFSIDWEQIPWSHNYDSGKFEWVDEDQVIMKEITFPDNSCQYVPNDEAEEVFNNWLKEHPNYHKNIYGSWVNE